eukprot:1635224-Pleurochrysis_carterae.AAC.2
MASGCARTRSRARVLTQTHRHAGLTILWSEAPRSALAKETGSSDWGDRGSDWACGVRLEIRGCAKPGAPNSNFLLLSAQHARRKRKDGG